MAEKESLKNNSNPDKTVDNSAKPVDKSVSKRGGARPGAGRPKGKMEAKTIEKMHIKKAFEDRVAKNADQLFNAQMSVALGCQYLFKRERSGTGKKARWGKFMIVEDPEEILKYLDGEFKNSATKYFMLSTEKPDVKAIDSLLDRGFGRAPQNLNIKDDRPDPIAALLGKFGLLDDEEEDSEDAEQIEGSESSTPTIVS